MSYQAKFIKKNGFNIGIINLKHSNIFGISINNNIGSTIERKLGDKYFGLTHFIEHLSFKSPNGMDTKSVMQELKDIGTYNAGTHFGTLDYFANCSSSKWKRAVELITAITFNDLTELKKEELDLERTIVLNEMAQYLNDEEQMMASYNNPFRLHKDDNVIGNKENIMSVTKEELIEFKKNFFNKKDLVLNIMFDGTLISEEEMLAFVFDNLNLYSDRMYEKETELQHLEFFNEDNDIEYEFENVQNAHIFIKDQNLLQNINLTSFSKELEEFFESRTGLKIKAQSVIEENALNTFLHYITSYHKKSINEYFREDKGLTYGVSAGTRGHLLPNNKVLSAAEFWLPLNSNPSNIIDRQFVKDNILESLNNMKDNLKDQLSEYNAKNEFKHDMGALNSMKLVSIAKNIFDLLEDYNKDNDNIESGYFPISELVRRPTIINEKILEANISVMLENLITAIEKDEFNFSLSKLERDTSFDDYDYK